MRNPADTNEPDRDATGLPEAAPQGEGLPARLGQVALTLLRPLARLFVSHGVTYSTAEALLKRAFFDAAAHELNRSGIQPNISRISVSSGLHRRDVKRLSERVDTRAITAAGEQGETPPHSLASEIYMRWSVQPQLVGRDVWIPLRGTSGRTSFEMLARETNRDAHPRALLEELRRLGLVRVDEQGNRVALNTGGFVPLMQRAELLGLLSDNVGAHLETAVGNVVDGGTRWLEQAVSEQGLTADEVYVMDRRSREIWQQVSAQVIGTLQQFNLAEPGANEKQAAGRHRVRIGMYMYTDLPRVDDSAQPINQADASSTE